MRSGDDLSAAARSVRGSARGRFSVTRLHRSGPSPHRVLLVGSRLQLAPPGVPRAEALSERIADRIWLRTRRGVDLDVLWELGPVLRAIGGGLSAWRLWRYDAVVVVSPARPARLLARLRQPGVDRLLQRVLREVEAASHVLVVSLRQPGPPEPAGPRHSTRPDTSGVPRVSAISVPEEAGADAVAERLTTLLRAADAGGEDGTLDAAHRRRRLPDVEDERQRAVDALHLRDRRVGRRLQEVVDMAQDAFSTATAEITIIDHDRQWTLVGAGTVRPDSPREDSLCSRSIRTTSPTLIGDTWTVPALRGNPLVTGPRPIRFYAAHPIESVDGYRIGVLCIWDDVPHDVDDFDAAAFRDLALLAEAEITGET